MESRHHFTRAMEQLKQSILEMGSMVEEALAGALQALMNNDPRLARQIMDGDDRINRMEMSIEDQTVILIATEQPVAQDLRKLITCLKVVTQLERMGDHAVHIAKAVLRISEETEEAKAVPLSDLTRMAEMAKGMLHDCLTAFMNEDTSLAISTAERDKKIDLLHNQVMKDLLTSMTKNGQRINQATTCLFISRWIERFGDHVTNICEWIIYANKGTHVEL